MGGGGDFGEDGEDGAEEMEEFHFGVFDLLVIFANGSLVQVKMTAFMM